MYAGITSFINNRIMKASLKFCSSSMANICTTVTVVLVTIFGKKTLYFLPQKTFKFPSIVKQYKDNHLEVFKKNSENSDSIKCRAELCSNHIYR